MASIHVVQFSLNISFAIVDETHEGTVHVGILLVYRMNTRPFQMTCGVKLTHDFLVLLLALLLAISLCCNV